MPDEIDWSLTTFKGNRRRQHEDFLCLSFREKLTVIEDLSAVAAQFAPKRPAPTAAERRTARRRSEAEPSSSPPADARKDGPGD